MGKNKSEMTNYQIDQEIEVTKGLPDNKCAGINSIINTVADKLAIPIWIVRAVNELRRDHPEMLLPNVDPYDRRFKIQLPLIKVLGVGDAHTYYHTLLEVYEACVDKVKYYQSKGFPFWDCLVTATTCLGLGSLRNTVDVMTVGNLCKEALAITSDQFDPHIILEEFTKTQKPILFPYALCERYDARYGGDWLKLEFKNKQEDQPDYVIQLMQRLSDAVAIYDATGGDWLSWAQPQALWHDLLATLVYDRYIWLECNDRYDRTDPRSKRVFDRMERGTFFTNGPSTPLKRFREEDRKIPLHIISKIFYVETFASRIARCKPEMQRTNVSSFEAARAKLWNLLFNEGYAGGGKAQDALWSGEFSDIDQWLQIGQLEIAFNEKYKITKWHGPEFLTRTDFKEAMQNNPFWIGKRFQECGITIPDALMDDLHRLYNLRDGMSALTGEDYKEYGFTLQDETFNFWMRLQTMGFSPEIIKTSEDE